MTAATRTPTTSHAWSTACMTMSRLPTWTLRGHSVPSVSCGLPCDGEQRVAPRLKTKSGRGN
eukprot:13817883-Alexandrium_andersonii.AAC.1